MKKTVLSFLFLSIALSGCQINGEFLGGSFTATIDSKPGHQSPSAIQSYGNIYDISAILPLSNGDKITLKKGTYKGNLNISQNKVSLKGNGAGKTVIEGTVYINGDSNELRDLTVSGNLIVYGNFNQISGIKVTGSIQNYGKYNKL
jgi:formylmethanofuran dehydrogenase subunit C